MLRWFHERGFLIAARSYSGIPYSGQIEAAVLLKIWLRVSSVIGRALNSSRFRLTSGTPGPGQSVPNRVLCAISSSRGKYFSRLSAEFR